MESKKLRLATSILLGIIVFGTLCYHYFEGMTLFDSFYMTIITISTVGYGEIKTLSVIGRLISLVIITTGISVGAYTIGSFISMLIEGELAKIFGRRKLQKEIVKLNNHYIICGFGRIGSLICEELKANDKKFVVIENNPANIEILEAEKYLYLCADATLEEAILQAGILKAAGIVPCVQSDADNVFITLTARGLRPDIFILSRASDEKAAIKIKRAGASDVVSPYIIGGRRMAQVILRPTVVDFLNMAMMDKELGLGMEEVTISDKSSLINKNIIESNLRKDFGIIIVGIKKFSGEMLFNPQPSVKLEANDVLVVLGKRADLLRMNTVI